MNEYLDQPLYREALKRQGYRTPGQLADAIGIAGGHARNIGNGLLPSEHVRQLIAEALKVPVSDLWRHVERR